MRGGGVGDESTRLRAVLWVALIALVAVSAVRAVRDMRPCLVPQRGTVPCFDLRIMARRLDEYQRTGVLYDTTGAATFDPRTTSIFKYPPPHALLVRALLPPDRPAGAMSRAQMLRLSRPATIVYLASLLLSLALLLWLFRPGGRRALLCLAVLLLWQANVESINGPQIEPLLLLVFTVSLALLGHEYGLWGGALQGLAGALKAYPWFFGAYYLWRRRWSTAAGVALGTAATFAVTAIFIPLHFTVEYLTRILPRLGGISNSGENVGVPAQIERLVFAILGRPLPTTLKLLPSGAADPPLLILGLVWVLLLAFVLGAGWASARALRRAERLERLPAHAIELGIGLCLLFMLMPSSWMNYQTLLLLPLLAGLAMAPPPRQDPLGWLLLLATAGLGAVGAGEYSPLAIAARSLVAPAMGAALLRLSVSMSAAPAAATASPRRAVPRLP
jgi:hypothetical protein